MGWEKILDLKDVKMLRAILIVIAFISVGLTIILVFFNSLFYSLDVVKLILLSVALSSPNLFLSLVYYSYLERNSKKIKFMTNLWLADSLVVFYIHLTLFLISPVGPSLNITYYFISYVAFMVVLILFDYIKPSNISKSKRESEKNHK